MPQKCVNNLIFSGFKPFKLTYLLTTTILLQHYLVLWNPSLQYCLCSVEQLCGSQIKHFIMDVNYFSQMGLREDDYLQDFILHFEVRTRIWNILILIISKWSPTIINISMKFHQHLGCWLWNVLQLSRHYCTASEILSWLSESTPSPS